MAASVVIPRKGYYFEDLYLYGILGGIHRLMEPEEYNFIYNLMSLHDHGVLFNKYPNVSSIFSELSNLKVVKQSTLNAAIVPKRMVKFNIDLLTPNDQMINHYTIQLHQLLFTIYAALSDPFIRKNMKTNKENWHIGRSYEELTSWEMKKKKESIPKIEHRHLGALLPKWLSNLSDRVKVRQTSFDSAAIELSNAKKRKIEDVTSFDFNYHKWYMIQDRFHDPVKFYLEPQHIDHWIHRSRNPSLWSSSDRKVYKDDLIKQLTHPESTEDIYELSD